MKKRNLTALALALALTLGLSVPALAAEGQYLVDGAPAPTIPADAEASDYLTLDVQDLVDAGMDPELIEVSLDRGEGDYPDYFEFARQYFADHPEHYAAFDADGFFAEAWGHYSKEEYMADMDMTDEEAFRQDMWDQWLMDYGYGWDTELYAVVEAAYQEELRALYSARHPGELEALKTEDLLSRQGYTETLTPVEQYMEDWGLNSEDQVRPTLLNTYVEDRIRAEQIHADYLVYAEGYPDQLAAFDADAYFAEEYPWYDSKAEYMQSYTLFTDREFAEAMFVEHVEQNYWEWNYEGDNWYDPDDWTYPDEDPKPLTLVVNGVPMADAVISAEDGWSYASVPTLNAIFGQHNVDDGEMKPLRAAAEAAGWDVGWNERNNTLFLLDGKSLKAQYAGSMAALDAVLDWALTHAEVKEGQSYKTTETVDMTLTMLDSLDGDKDYKVDVTVEALQRDAVVELTVTVNAADLFRLLGDDLAEALAAELPKLTVKDLKNLLGGVKCSAILDLEQGNFYFNLPLLSAFDKTVSEDTWYAVSLGMGVDETLTDSLGMTLTDLAEDLPNVLAEVIYQSLLDDSAHRWTSPEDAFAETETAVAFLGALAGPDTLKKSGTTLTWTVDTKAMNTLFSEVLGVEAAPFKVYELEYVMKGDGSFTYDVAVRPDMAGLARASMAGGYGSPALSILAGRLLGLFDFRVEGHSAGTADKAAGTVEYHQKNAFRLELDMDSERRAVRQSPAAMPPEGAAIVEL